MFDKKISPYHLISHLFFLILFFGLSLLVLLTANNVPVWDAWHNPALFDRLLSGSLQLSDILAPINGHRLVVPRLFYLSLGYLSNYDVRWELVCNLVLTLIIFYTFKHSITDKLICNGTWYFFTNASLTILLLSLVQYENWYFGWQLCYFLCITFSLLSLYLLTCSSKSFITFVSAIFFGIIATFSFANGVLVWPLGILFFIFSSRSIRHLSFWIISGSTAVLLFLYGSHEETSLDLQRLHYYGFYILMYLGAPLSIKNHVIASVWGAIGIFIFCYFLFDTRTKKNRTELQLPILFCFYSLLAGILISIGRLNYGLEYALLSRYTSFSTIFWASISILIFYRISTTKSNFDKRILVFFISMIILSSIKGTFSSFNEFFIHKTRTSLAIAELRKQNPDQINRNLIKNITWDVDFTLNQAKILKKYRLSLYSDDPNAE